jgi:hypothetical protein
VALRDKVRSNWLKKQGFYAPSAGQSFKGGPAGSAAVNAQAPNRAHKRTVVGKKRKPRYKTF